MGAKRVSSRALVECQKCMEWSFVEEYTLSRRSFAVHALVLVLRKCRYSRAGSSPRCELSAGSRSRRAGTLRAILAFLKTRPS
jgi:hypothetical protein